MIFIPPRETKKIIQTNRSDLLGNVWSSFNLDLESNLGAIRVSPRMILKNNELNGCPVAFRYFDTLLWSVAGTKVYSNTNGLPFGAFSEDASSGVPTACSSDESDMELFNSTLCVTGTDGLYSKVANGSGTGAWTKRDDLNPGTPHILAYFKKYDRLYYTNSSDNIISVGTDNWTPEDPGSDYAISLSTDSDSYSTLCMKPDSGRMWVGVMDRSNKASNGKMIDWNGLSATITKEYEIIGAPLSLLIDKERDIPFVITSLGILYRWNGTGFSNVGRLPISRKLLKNAFSIDNNRFIHQNGMVMTNDGNIRVFVNSINGDNASTVNENFQAGVYEFTPLADYTYSCHHVSTPSLYSSTVTDYGQSRFSQVGALFPLNLYSTSSSMNGTFYAGATYYTGSTSTSSGIFYDDSNNTLQKAGYFVTTWIRSQQVKDTWQKAVGFLRQLLDSDDKIVIKYRTREASPSSDLTITWYNGGSMFKTSESLTSWAVGDEVEVVQGVGSGLCAHITAINDLGGGVSEVSIDESISTAANTDTAKIRIQKWKRASSVTDQTVESYNFPIGVCSERIQLKCWMRFKGDDELFEIALINIVNQKL